MTTTTDRRDLRRACDLAAGADLIWLATDEDDWPKELYAKLGFRPIGRIFTFMLQSDSTRRPPA